MSGFDNSTQQSGVFAQAKQFGAIIRGMGPPVPQAGVLGDVYIDTISWQLYSKRENQGTDPWGNYLFVVPVAYRTALKWFSAFAPTPELGRPGDYCLAWAGWANYGLQPSVYGPKQATDWPENGVGPDIPVAVAGSGTVLQIGLSGEGPALAMSNSTQLIALGLTDEYVLAVPVEVTAGDPVQELGLQSGPAFMPVNVNPLYPAQNVNNP